MNKITRFSLVALSLAFACPLDNGTLAQDLNTILMESTFRIEGPMKGTGKLSTGTVFIIGRPSTKNPSTAYFVLVTAHHVLDTIKGENAILHLRRKLPDHSYSRLPVSIRIRLGDKNLWTSHPDPSIDVAAMYISLPNEVNVPLLTTNFLATDSTFVKYEIHPGDELFCLGYPFGFESTEVGFSVLRSGKISSFPLIPFKVHKQFLFDFQVFGGNSGGPVYFSQLGRPFGGMYHLDEEVQFIAGLVSKQIELTERVLTLFETKEQRYSLALAIVVPAQFIKETIDLLPVKE